MENINSINEDFEHLQQYYAYTIKYASRIYHNNEQKLSNIQFESVQEINDCRANVNNFSKSNILSTNTLSFKQNIPYLLSLAECEIETSDSL